MSMRETQVSIPGLAQLTRRFDRKPFDGLVGDLRDEFEHLVDVQDGEPRKFCQRCEQEMRDRRRTMMTRSRSRRGRGRFAGASVKHCHTMKKYVI